jgi:phosphatidylglycerol---prolipoprotein diacylglyceryl transferase
VFPVLQIGPAAIQTSGLLIILGFFLGLTLSERYTRKRGENSDLVTNLVLLITLASLVTARLTFVVSHPALFQNNPTSLLSPDPRLLDSWGGFAGAAIAAVIFGQRKHLKFWDSLDRLTPLLAVIAVFIGFAHLASGQAFGSQASLPWALELWGAKRHPSQVYETTGAIAILLLLWRQFSSSGVPGTLFLKFTALSSGLFVFLSAFRGDSRLILGSFRQEQLLALVFLGLSLLLVEIRSSPGKLDSSQPSIKKDLPG